MSPEAHLFASWVVAAKATKNPRDCRLVALAGILPDADGLGLIIDVVGKSLGFGQTNLYQQYHHLLLHGIFGGLLITAALACFARDRGRVALLAFLVFHLHLLCDLVGSRGPAAHDLWPIYYFGPFTKEPMWVWKGQWRLDGWQNRIISLTLMAWVFRMAIQRGHSFVGVFHRGADRVFVKVLRKWRDDFARYQQTEFVKQLKRPPWRTMVPGVFLLLVVFFGYALWQPGLVVRDGRNDLKRNGIWIGHGWLGADEWFIENGKTNSLDNFRDPARIEALAARLRKHHLRDVFPHLCPAGLNGQLPPVDGAQVERFLTAFEGFRVMPWIGGPNGSSVRGWEPKWRAAFVNSVTNLLAAHPRFAGVQLNVEPLTSGDEHFLKLLEELRAALPKGKILSVAAYPPPTRWHPFPDVHWEEKYFREVARRSDQMAVMMYDTALRVPKLYQKLMADWTVEALSWSEGRPVLLGIPTYDDANTDYHHPEVENMKNALLGIHRAFEDDVPPPNYQGVAIYCEWETDEAEWKFFKENFLRR